MAGTLAIASKWSRASSWLLLGLLTLSFSCSQDPPGQSKGSSAEEDEDSSQDDAEDGGDDNEESGEATSSGEKGSSGAGTDKKDKTAEEDGEADDDDDEGSKSESGGSGKDSKSEGEDSSGSGDSSEGGGEDSNEKPKEKPRGAFVTANLDDDNGNGTADFNEGYFAEDNDIAPWKLPVFDKGTKVELEFSGALAKLRIWKDGKDWMGKGKGQVPSSFSYTSDGKALELQVEMGDFNAKAKVKLSPEKGDAIDLDIAASPLILNHHLQPLERAFVVSVGGNRSMVQDLQKIFGSRMTTISGSRYGGDVWIQDEIEFATMTGMNGARINIVMESIRERGNGSKSLSSYPKAELTGSSGRKKDWLYGIWGRGKRATSGDSFGNLEASPPVTVKGKKYPFGRIYYGNVANGKLNQDLEKFLKSQEIQDPVALDTEWLCVSHVDEIMTFIPDKSAPKGFRLLFGDTRSGFKLLKEIGGNAALGAGYSRLPGAYRRVSDIINNRALKDLNQRIQEDDLDPTLAKVKKEFGLDDKDIILFPSVFHKVTGCRGRYESAALIPGTVNMLVDPGKAGQKAKLVMPDPFLRSSGSPKSQDPFIAHTKKILPKDLELHFVDDWETYHAKHGEVHCGTNAMRTPTAKWWE